MSYEQYLKWMTPNRLSTAQELLGPMNKAEAAKVLWQLDCNGSTSIKESIERIAG